MGGERGKRGYQQFRALIVKNKSCKYWISC
jgi:hypothetical protein